MDFNAAIQKIETRQDFIDFVHLLMIDLQNNGDKWENPDLPRYLEALAAWTHDMDGAFKNRGEEPPQHPTWKLFAEILIAASIYE